MLDATEHRTRGRGGDFHGVAPSHGPGPAHPDRFAGLIVIAAVATRWACRRPAAKAYDFHDRATSDEGWARSTGTPGSATARLPGILHRRDVHRRIPPTHPGRRRLGRWRPPPNPSRATTRPVRRRRAAKSRQLLQAIACPALAIWGTDDHCQPPERRRAYAELTGGAGDHGGGWWPPLGPREPVAVNHWIRDFAHQVCPPPIPAVRASRRPAAGPTRALSVVTDRPRTRPPGPGHCQRPARAAPLAARSTGSPSTR